MERENVTLRECFPSDYFLQKHFDKNIVVTHGNKNTNLYQLVRSRLQYALYSSPSHLLKAESRANDQPSPVFVFDHYKLDERVKSYLVNHNLIDKSQSKELIYMFEEELCDEFISFLVTHPPPQYSWWRWRTEETGSVWVEAIPEAIQAGEHKRRSLTDKLKGIE